MKTISMSTWLLLLMFCSAMVWAFSDPGPATTPPQNQQSLMITNHQIDLVTALQMIKNYQENQKYSSIAVKGGYFARDAFEKILAQPGVVGIRYYFAQKDEGTLTIILVGVDEKGKDVQTGVIMERAMDCPPWCPEGSELSR